ncbi:hypothetical protein HK100_009785 [Physocladia obscura]|uniref:FAD-binding domain-containing protein n=1 Tax=Physocladia obscura TaxID=109957 RepID=A0AAD5T450_9FUNG|nr:hypothetical protein HK100_009785 [Physocladia obscura]
MPSVIVIGAGPVGVATAYGLRKLGFTVSVYDRIEAEETKQNYVDFGETKGGAVCMFTNGFRALSGLGLADKVRAHPHFENVDMMITKMDGSDPIPHYIFTAKDIECRQFLRYELHTSILEACGEAGVKLFLNKNLVHIEQTVDTVSAIFEDGTNVTADVLIGADGIYSATRRLVFPEYPQARFWSIGYVGVFERGQIFGEEKLELDYGQTLYNDMVTGNFIFAVQCSDRYGSWFVMEMDSKVKDIDKNESWKPATDLPHHANKLASRVEKWGAPKNIIGCVRSAFRITPLAIYDLPDLPSYQRGRVVLVGDAAHGTMPTMGQGLNMGFEDAASLCDLFSEFSADQYETVFKLYDELRLKRCHAVVHAAREIGERMNAGNPMKASIGRFLMKTFFAIFSFFNISDYAISYDYSKHVKKAIENFRTESGNV